MLLGFASQFKTGLWVARARIRLPTISNTLALTFAELQVGAAVAREEQCWPQIEEANQSLTMVAGARLPALRAFAANASRISRPWVSRCYATESDQLKLSLVLPHEVGICIALVAN